MRAAAAARGDRLAVARIDRAASDLLRAGEPFRLRTGQLLIVDEASLAGTLTLDQLATQASQAGAKLLLVGDHYQLSSVDAGGAFGLLATETNAVELTSLWRFDHEWEAEAGQQLRVGDTACLDTYAAHGRLHEGPAEAVAADAYTAWETATRAGQQALLIAADNATVAELNTQARAGRVRNGLVEPVGARLHDDTIAGVGDVVVTRANRRDLRTSNGAWVRNGDLWTVLAREDDGSLTVQRNHRSGTRPPHRSTLRLPAPYVAEHVELGYATTAHRAQGMTVDATFSVLRPGMSRELAYVALTRGRKENHAFIATDIPDPSYDGGPAPEKTARQVLQQILATRSTEISATETLRALQDDATSLAQLAPIHETLVQTAQRQRWTNIIVACGFTDEQATAILGSPACGALVAALRRAEHDGHSMHRVLPALVDAAPLHAAENDSTQSAPAHDIAAVLHHRVTAWHDHTQPSQGGRVEPLIGGIITPAGPLGDDIPVDQRAAIEQVEALITSRIDTVTRQLVADPPTWLLRALGRPPADPRRRDTWINAAGTIAAYRDRYSVPEHGHPLGEADPADPAQRRNRDLALLAARQVRDLNTPKPFVRHAHGAEAAIDRTPSL
jgi:hypothetical protein